MRYKEDTRAIIARFFIGISLSISSLGIFLSNIPILDKIILFFMFITYAIMIFIGINVLKKTKTAMLIFLLLAVYLWFAFFIKLALTINFPETTWVTSTLFSPEVVSNEISGSFFTIYLGLLALPIGFLIRNNYAEKKYDESILVIKHKVFFITISGLLILRFFNQTVLNIGMPGVKPDELPIPFLTGILEMLSSAVVMSLVNLYFYSIFRLKERKGLWSAGLLMLLNVFMGLRVGYKSELVIQVLLLIYYVVDVREFLSISQRKNFLITTILCIVIVVFIYPYVNYYRTYMINGGNMTEAVNSALKDNDSGSFLVEFSSRINGIDVYYAATKLAANNNNINFFSLFNQDVMELIKFDLYGAAQDDAVTAFGTTQFSVLYLMDGVISLTLGAFIIGWGIRWLITFIPSKILKSPVAFASYLPSFCLLCISFLSSGGEMLLFIKKLFIVIVSLFIAEKVCYVKKRNHRVGL